MTPYGIPGEAVPLPGYRAALTNAPPWVVDAAQVYSQRTAQQKLSQPFLYFMLGGRETPAFKTPKRDAYYLDPSPIPGFSCATCPYSYQSVTRKIYICSQVRGPIKPAAWCAIPHFQKGVWRPLTVAEARKVRGLTWAKYGRPKQPQVQAIVDPRLSKKTPTAPVTKRTMFYAGPDMGAPNLLAQAALAPYQLVNARLILRQFILAGFPTGIALAAVVNSKAESNLDANAIGDDGKSLGLFQLASFGAGKEMAMPLIAPGRPNPQDPRFNATANTARIIAEVRTHGGPLSAAYQSGASIAELAAIYSRDIERPRDKLGEMERRRSSARKMFPGIANLPANMLPPGFTLLPALAPIWVYGGLASVFGLSVIALGLFATRR